MSSFRSKLLFSVLAYGFVIGAVVGAIFYYWIPEFFSNWYFVILVLFIILEVLVVMYVERSSQKSTDRQLINAYLATKVVKTIAVLGIVGIYAIAVKQNLKEFVVMTITLYVLFLAVETLSLTRIEKHLKEKK